MSALATPESPGTTMRRTTARREWLGWFGAISWLFFTMYGYDMLMLQNYSAEGYGRWNPLYYMLILALSITVLGWRYGRNPDGLSKIAHYTTPVAIVMTAVFTSLPPFLGSILYLIAPVFMAPTITRRVYGVICTSAPNRRLIRYMSGIAVCVAIFTVSVAVAPPKEIAFLIPALLSVFAWAGVRRSVPLLDEAPGTGAFKLSRRIIGVLIVAVAVFYLLDVLYAVIHTQVMFGGDEITSMIFSLLGGFLPLAGFIIYAVIGDKGHERIGFVCGMALFIIGIQLAYLPGGQAGAFLFPLAIADGLGGSYTEFFILTAPIYFLINAKRPIFVASLGVTLNLISSAVLYSADEWLPEALMVLDTPLLASASIIAVVFIALVYILFVRQREKSLAAALYALLHTDLPEVHAETNPAAEPETQETLQPGVMDELFTQEELEVALLLMEGETQHSISRKLNRPAADVSQQMNALRKIVIRKGDPNPGVSAAIVEFGLTRREADMLRCLFRGLTNAEISAELFLSEETVKTHVRNLMKKLPVDNRVKVADWIEAFGATL